MMIRTRGEKRQKQGEVYIPNSTFYMGKVIHIYSLMVMRRYFLLTLFGF